MPSVLLPGIRENFALTLTQGVAIIVILDVSCNLVQILTGHLRADKTKPLFMQLGLTLAALVTFTAFVPHAQAFYILGFLFLLAGCGIAIAHPEALRSVHAIDGIAPTLATSIFMTAGFLGFSSGGYIASLFISKFGTHGLAWAIVFPITAITLLYITKTRLAVEGKSCEVNETKQRDVYTFWMILVLSIPVTIASTTLVRLLPSRLNELGFSLEFAGKSVLLYGVGSAIGAIAWANLAHKKGELITTSILMMIGVPFLALYLKYIESAQAIWLLMASGFFATAPYSFIVTMGKKAKGLKLGQRMGFIVGGSWGLASLILLALSKPADIYGIEKIMPIVPSCFAISSLIGFGMYFKNRTRTQ